MIRHRSAASFSVLFGFLFLCFQTACRDSDRLRQAIFEAEESRAPNEASLKILVDALKHSDAGIRRTGVRALGRLARPTLVDKIAPLLDDSNAAVRAEAANALAQSVTDIKPGGLTSDNAANKAAIVGDVFNLLETRLKTERNPEIRGVIVRTIGRLAYPNEIEYRKAERNLFDSAGEELAENDPARRPEVYGAAKGIESLLRRKAKTIQVDEALVARLKALAVAASPSAGNPASLEEIARIRRLAIMALTWAGRLDEQTLQKASVDADDQVRRLALAGWGRMKPEQIPAKAGELLIRQGLEDRSGMVRYEALRLYGRAKLALDSAPVSAAVDDISPHVALLAVDLLGQLKTVPDQIITKLKRIAEGHASAAASAAGNDEGGTNVSERSLSRVKLMAAHALVSLSKTAPDQAGILLPGFMADPDWVVRLYAAEAAAALKDIPALERLVVDSQDNVRNAALSCLIALKGHTVDDLNLAALERDDYQLVLTAVGGLKGSPSADRAVPALVSALARLTAQKRETSRDPRLSILERLGELGSPKQTEAVSAYLKDFDPLVASAAAKTIGRWTGRTPEIDPQPLPVAYARLSEGEKLRGATVRVTMAGNGSFEMVLFIDEAPATVARFTALVRSGYYDGLTIHRIVPNFLIQGGSPGANEYTGDGMFMRDESGLESNGRGTVGISTRGRDTGDAQFYINTVDNDRLDHDYCVFARVTSGMDIVDRVLEGDIIERMELILK